MMQQMDRETYLMFGRIGHGELSGLLHAFIERVSDADLAARRAYLESLRDDPDEDLLTGSGYAELRRIEDEQQRRLDAQLCPCCRGYAPNLAPGTICALCSGWPLD